MGQFDMGLPLRRKQYRMGCQTDGRHALCLQVGWKSSEGRTGHGRGQRAICPGRCLRMESETSRYLQQEACVCGTCECGEVNFSHHEQKSPDDNVRAFFIYTGHP